MKPAEAKRLAELAGCTLSSPGGNGLQVYSGATVTMDGGSISGCGAYGVWCQESGSTATVRPPAAAPSAAPLSAASAGRGGVFQSCFAVFCRRFLAHRNRRDEKMSLTRKDRAKKTIGKQTNRIYLEIARVSGCG